MPERSSDITVAIPSIPIRGAMLARALRSVAAQSMPPSDVAIAFDVNKEGAPSTRTRALDRVRTSLTAFLDDDDELGARHLAKCYAHMVETGADLVFPWFVVEGGTDPFPQHFGKVWDITPDNLDQIRQFPITILVKTELMRSVGFHNPPEDAQLVDGQRAGEDLRAWVELVKAGAKISHLPERTWIYHHHGSNTSGMPTKW